MTKIQFSSESWSAITTANEEFETANATLNSKIRNFNEEFSNEISKMDNQLNGQLKSVEIDTGQKDYEGNSIKETLYWFENSNGKIEGVKNSNSNVAKDDYQSKINFKINSYKDYGNNANKKINDFYKETSDLHTELKDLFNALNNAITKFESTPFSLSEAIKSLEETYGGLVGLSVDTVDGVEVINYTYTDQDGNEITISLAEAVNAFYTYVGSSTSNMIVNEYILENMKDLTPEQQEEYRLRAMVNTGAYVDSLSENGFMSIATDESIRTFYNDIAIKNGFDEDMDIQYKSTITSYGFTPEAFGEMLGEDTNSLGMALGGVAMAMAFSSKYSFVEKDEDGKIKTDSDGNVSLKKVTEDEAAKNQDILENKKKNQEVIDENIDNFVKKREEVKSESEDENINSDTVLNEVDKKDAMNNGQVLDKENAEMNDAEVEADGIEELLPEGEIEPQPEGPVADSEITPDEATEIETIPEDDPKIKEEISKIPDDVVDDVKDKIDDLAEANPPEELEKEKVTSEDVDNQARDEYYASKTPDQLASDRNKAIEEFDKMPTEVKVKALEGMGYTTTVAAALAADQVKGQAAYIRGLEEQQLAMISNNIASNQGVNNHDTVFDDGHDMSYVESGQVNKDLTPTSQKVQTARQQLTSAKNNYDNSVTEANDSIDKAKKAKEKYDQTLKKIKDTNGEDPKKWTTEQIDEYNSAAKDYNEAIADVNKAVSNVDSKKAEYETQKDNYNAACEEYNQFAAEELEKGQEGNILAEEQNVATGNGNNITDDMFTDALGQPQSGESEGSKPVSDIQNVSDNTELSQDKDPVIIFTDSVTYEDEKKEE